MQKRKRASARVLAVMVLAALAVSAAACGSSSSSSSSQNAAASTSTPNSGGGSACVTRARATVDHARQELPVKVPTQSVDMSKNRGKSVWLILVVTNQFTETVAQNFQQAASKAGMKPVVFDGKGQASEWVQGVSQAVAQHAGGIILWAIPPQVVAAPLKGHSNIKVIDVFNGGPSDPLPPGDFAHVTSDFNHDGNVLASWMMADSGCKAHVALFSPSVLTLYRGLTQSVPAALKQCSGCSYVYKDEDLANVATQLGPSVTDTLRSNPNINYVMSANDSQITFMLPAVRGTAKVKIVGHDGIPASLAMIRNGGPQAATMAFPPERWIAFAITDEIARAMAGAKPIDDNIPARLVDKTNVGASPGATFANWSGFEQKFLSAWGVK